MKNSSECTKKLLTGMIILIVLFIFPSLTWAIFGGKVESYSAENVELSADGKIENTTTIYVTPEAVRFDGMPGQGGMPGQPKVDITMLMLKEKNKQYIYNHDKKLVYEATLEDENTAGVMQSMKNAQSEKVLGKEKVSGYKCVKKEIVTTMEIMGMTQKNKIVVWQNDKFEFPLRTLTENGEVQELRNIKPGKQAKKLFEPISGYKKVNNMMAIFGMDFGSMMEDAETDQNREQQMAAPSGMGGNPDKADVKPQAVPQSEGNEGGDQQSIENTLKNLGDSLKKFSFGN